MVLGKDSLSNFEISHPLLQNFSLEFVDQPKEFRIEFSVLNINCFELTISRFIDTDGEFSEWIKKNKNLEQLNIVTGDLLTNEGLYFQRFIKCIGTNQSLRKLSITQSYQDLFEYSDNDFPGQKYDQHLIDLLEAIAGNTHITELHLSLHFRNFIKSEHSSKWQTLLQFEALESAKPGLSLSLDGSKFGPRITEMSSAINIPANEFIERFGWEYAEQAPGPEVDVKFQVEMPSWGHGAFRKRVVYLNMSFDDQKKYILDGLRDKSLPKENIVLLSVGPKEEQYF